MTFSTSRIFPLIRLDVSAFRDNSLYRFLHSSLSSPFVLCIISLSRCFESRQRRPVGRRRSPHSGTYIQLVHFLAGLQNKRGRFHYIAINQHRLPQIANKIKYCVSAKLSDVFAAFGLGFGTNENERNNNHFRTNPKIMHTFECWPIVPHLHEEKWNETMRSQKVSTQQPHQSVEQRRTWSAEAKFQERI